MSKPKNIGVDDFWQDCLTTSDNKPKPRKIPNANKKNRIKNTNQLNTFLEALIF